MQLISGMSLFGYWAANLLSDVIKAFVPIAMILLLCWAIDVWYDGAWVLFCLYPFAVVPFSYVTSFLFASDSVAQICTLFNHAKQVSYCLLLSWNSEFVEVAAMLKDFNLFEDFGHELDERESIFLHVEVLDKVVKLYFTILVKMSLQD